MKPAEESGFSLSFSLHIFIYFIYQTRGEFRPTGEPSSEVDPLWKMVGAPGGHSQSADPE